MKRFLNVSRARWILLGASLVLAAVAITVRWRGLPQAIRPERETQALLAEQTRLAPFTDDALQRLRAELARHEAQTATPGQVPAPWQTQALPADAGAARTRYAAGEAIRWSEVVALVERLEREGQIESLDIRSRGSRTKREIASVEIIVRSIPGTTRRQAGATLPDAKGPASSRKVGPGPSLRPSAPSRPDPPG